MKQLDFLDSGNQNIFTRCAIIAYDSLEFPSCCFNLTFQYCSHQNVLITPDIIERVIILFTEAHSLYSHPHSHTDASETVFVKVARRVPPAHYLSLR